MKTPRLPASASSASTRARRFAALSGPFRPEDALAAADIAGLEPDAVATIASALAQVCDTRHDGEGALWLMRAVERERELAAHHDLALARAVGWRRKKKPLDPASKDLLDALSGTGRFAPAALTDLLERALIAPQHKHRQDLIGIATALERIGSRLRPPEQHRDNLAKARIAIGRIEDADDRGSRAQPFVARDEEMARIQAWIDRPKVEGPVTILLVSGAPGIGKSTLLDLAAAKASARAPFPLVVKLDFDRSGLDILDPVGLTLEVARQIGAQLPDAADAIRRIRVAASGTGRDLKTRGERPDDLAPALTAALREAVVGAKAKDRPVLVALDTVETVRGSGATHPQRLFAWLDTLFALGLCPLAILATGRGDAFEALPERVGARVPLVAFSPDKAEAALSVFGAPGGTGAEIAALAERSVLVRRLEGNPLMLRVAADLAKASGVAALGERGEQAIAAAMLARILLSRIADPDLRALVRPGLIVRWISPVFVSEALAKVLAVTLDGPSHAERLVGLLSRQQWLFETREGKPWIRMRADARHMLLPLLYLDDPQRCAKVDEAATEWFEAQGLEWAAAEAAYHRLQLIRADIYPAPVDSSVTQWFGAQTKDDLPEAAMVTLSESAPSDASDVIVDRKWTAIGAGSVDSSGASDLRAYMERSDWAEAALIYGREFAAGRILDPRSDAANAARTFLWRTGRWGEALFLLRQADFPDDADLADLRLLDAIVRLEMRAEFEFERLAGRLRAAAPGAALHAAVARIPLSGSAFDLTLGALGFCLEAAGIARPQVATQIADAVGASLDLWTWREGARMEEARPRSRLLQIVAVANDQRVARGFAPLPEDDTPAPRSAMPWSQVTCARALAALSPYASVLEHAVRADRTLGLERRAAHAFGALHGRAGAWFQLQGVTQLACASPIAALRDVGLLAEWAGLAAARAEGEDVKRIAGSAERFRRTVAGAWSYAAPAPPNWRGPEAAEGRDILMVQARATAEREPGEAPARTFVWAQALGPPLRGKAATDAAPSGSQTGTDSITRRGDEDA